MERKKLTSHGYPTAFTPLLYCSALMYQYCTPTETTIPRQVYDDDLSPTIFMRYFYRCP